jgi:hypothetical protein
MTVVNLKLPIRFEDLQLYFGYCFAPVGSLKDKFNTFIEAKLINKSIKGIFLQEQKSSLEQLKITDSVLK